MKAKLKESVDFVQYSGEDSLEDIEELFDKYGYDTAFTFNESNKRLIIYYKKKEENEFINSNSLLLTVGNYLIFHDVFLNKLYNYQGPNFCQLSELDFISLFKAETNE